MQQSKQVWSRIERTKYEAVLRLQEKCLHVYGEVRTGDTQTATKRKGVVDQTHLRKQTTARRVTLGRGGVFPILPRKGQAKEFQLQAVKARRKSQIIKYIKPEKQNHLT